MNSFLLQFEEENGAVEAKIGSEVGFEVLERERESYFSLDVPSFESSVLDGARSKVDLRGEGYVWTPIWWSSDSSKR